MKKFFIGAGMAIMLSPAIGQNIDSIQTHVLEEVVINGVQTEADTLQTFYRSNPSATTETILSRMKGISLIRRGAYGQELVFRSLSGSQLNVTIDGMKIFGACTDKMDPSTIYVEPQNLSVLQFTGGTEGASFGSTFGGTLDMKMAEAKVGAPDISGKIVGDYQTAANNINHLTAVNIAQPKGGYRISAAYRKSDSYHAGNGKIIPFSQYEKLNVAATTKHTLSKYDTLQVSLLYDEGWNIGFPALPMDAGNARA